MIDKDDQNPSAQPSAAAIERRRARLAHYTSGPKSEVEDVDRWLRAHRTIDRELWEQML